MLMPGTLLGERYEIIEKIGAGGMSIVYKAKDNRLQRYVAIKELREEFVKDDEFVHKFRKEALSAASLSHPNIVGIYDVGNDHEVHYIVMEYVEGQTLKELIAEKGPFDSKTVLELGIQIVAALKHAHQKKIIHRDIKPQNILMANDGTLKVTDFGIAKAVDSSTIVATNNAIGSVHYFSPEQAKGKYVNESSDLYSCGIVLFELATKRLPFEAESHISIALKHINEELPRPSSINPDVPQNLENIILKATAKNQADRYQNADEMLRDMKGVLHDPSFEVKGNDYVERTILLSAEETQLLREGQKDDLRGDNVKYGNEDNVDIFEDHVDFNENKDEDSGEVSTFYKVVASMGGVLATLAIVVVITLACVFWLPGLGKAKTYSVPKVTELSLEEAQTLLRKSGLKFEVVQKETEEVANGTVIDQDPAAGTAVKKNSTVTVTVAIGGEDQSDENTKEVTMPDFTGQDATDVTNEIIKLGLVVGDTSYDYDEEIEAGKVIRQDPVADTKVKAGSSINLIISKGTRKADKVAIPNLVGSTVDEAKTTLSGLKLTLGRQKEEYSDTEAGYIIRQSLSVGTTVEEGTKVDITVSKGPKEVEPSNKPTESVTPSAPAESTKPSEPTVVAKSYTIELPEGTEIKESYHLLVQLTLDDGSTKIVTDETVAHENFPRTISFSGTGTGKLDIYIDGKGYQDSITF